jgi:hypothetical protein
MLVFEIVIAGIGGESERHISKKKKKSAELHRK